MLTLPFFLPLSPVVVLLSTTPGVFTLLFGILPTFIELSKVTSLPAFKVGSGFKGVPPLSVF